MTVPQVKVRSFWVVIFAFFIFTSAPSLLHMVVSCLLVFWRRAVVFLTPVTTSMIVRLPASG